jgi:hypothetical protein
MRNPSTRARHAEIGYSAAVQFPVFDWNVLLRFITYSSSFASFAKVWRWGYDRPGCKPSHWCSPLFPREHPTLPRGALPVGSAPPNLSHDIAALSFAKFSESSQFFQSIFDTRLEGPFKERRMVIFCSRISQLFVFLREILFLLLSCQIRPQEGRSPHRHISVCSSPEQPDPCVVGFLTHQPLFFGKPQSLVRGHQRGDPRGTRIIAAKPERLQDNLVCYISHLQYL